MEAKALSDLKAMSIAATEMKVNPDFLVTALPNNMEVFDMEKYMPTRREYRGHYATPYIASFVEYVKQFKDQGSDPVCFIDPEAMRAVCVFDLGDVSNPGHGKHKATLFLEMTAAFEMLVEAIKEDWLSQKAMAAYLTDWRNVLSCSDGEGKEMSIAHAVHAVRNMTISHRKKSTHIERDTGSSSSSLEDIETISSGIRLDTITLDAAPYQGLIKRSIKVSVDARSVESVKPGKDVVLFGLRIDQREALMEDISSEFAMLINTHLGGIKTFLGDFRY